MELPELPFLSQIVPVVTSTVTATVAVSVAVSVVSAVVSSASASLASSIGSASGSGAGATPLVLGVQRFAMLNGLAVNKSAAQAAVVGSMAWTKGSVDWFGRRATAGDYDTEAAPLGRRLDGIYGLGGNAALPEGLWALIEQLVTTAIALPLVLLLQYTGEISCGRDNMFIHRLFTPPSVNRCVLLAPPRQPQLVRSPGDGGSRLGGGGLGRPGLIALVGG